MVSSLVKNRVVKKLAELYPGQYSHDNVMLAATHTHSAPGGQMDYLLYSLTSLGFIESSADCVVRGVVGAIERAHRNIQEASLSFAQGRVANASHNRSPTAYSANSPTLLKEYAQDGNTDPVMTLLKITSTDESRRVLGAVNWFSVHATSMNNSNEMVSADNKGYSSWLLEKELNTLSSSDAKLYRPYTDDHNFIARDAGKYIVVASSQAQEGDVSPNTEGAFCLDTGLPCDMETSGCPDKKGRLRNKMCHARGPGWEKGDTESSRLIGLRQYLTARSLVQELGQTLNSVVDFAHAWIPIADMDVAVNGTVHHTCLPARGFSFAAGTTDGPGEFDFLQGDLSGSPFWRAVGSLISKPSPTQVACHAPKPILLNTGECTVPYLWEARVVDIQIIRLGELILCGVPAEFTTMSGRLLRSAVRDIFVQSGTIPADQIKVLVVGLTNSYSGYVATFDEYQVQRYEGASTIYGPHTLDAYIQEFRRLALTMVPEDLRSRVRLDLPAVAQTGQPEDLDGKLLTFLPKVLFDAVPIGVQFGDVVHGKGVKDFYSENETASVTFWSGHPRNLADNPDIHLDHTVGSVEKYTGPTSEELTELLQGQVTDFRVNFVDDKVIQVFPQVSSVQQLFRRERVLIYATRQTSGLVQVWSMKPTEKQLEEALPIWKRVRDDDDPDVRVKWEQKLSGPLSQITVEWDVSARPDVDMIQSLGYNEQSIATADKVEGVYRMRYNGAHKNPFGTIRQHSGVSSMFVVGRKDLIDMFQ
jgi:neutral ceramidase